MQKRLICWHCYNQELKVSMKLFDNTFESKKHLSSYLTRLNLQVQAPGLEFLNLLINSHQHTVPFENLSRICDFHEQPDKFPSCDLYLSRLHLGYGGVCWSLARSFHWLLKNLGYNVTYLYMDPGHVCLNVVLDQDYYVDIGYGAPVFKATPLYESFLVKTNAEIFDYSVSDNTVVVIRTPGPTKTMSLNAVPPEEIERQFRDRNTWEENKFLNMALIQKFSEQKLVRLKNGVLTDFRNDKPLQNNLNQQELQSILEDFFMIDPTVYFRAEKYLGLLK